MKPKGDFSSHENSILWTKHFVVYDLIRFVQPWWKVSFTKSIHILFRLAHEDAPTL